METCSASDLDAFLHISPNAVIIVDEKNVIVKSNEHACIIFGYSQLDGRPLSDLIPPALRESHLKYCDRYLSNTHTRTGRVFRGFKADESAVAIEVGLRTVVVNGDKRIVAVVRELNEMRQFDTWSTFVNASSDGVLILNEKDYIKDTNFKFCSMSGYDRSDVLMGSLYTFCENNLSGNSTLRRKDGTYLRVNKTALSLNIDCEEYQMIIFHDRSVEHAYEEQLIEAREAAKMALTARTEFLNAVNHELRTPLNGITAYIQFLQETALSQEQVDYVRIMQQCSDALSAVINDILDSSKIVSGTMTLNPSDVDLKTLIGEICAVACVSKQRDVRFEKDLDCDVRVRVDVQRFKQIVFNLLSNAFKFTEEGRVQLKVYLRDDHIVVEVEDTGIGISASEKDEVFTMFYRAHTTYAGTGLGLALCKKLCQLMDGDVQCTRTEVGAGSTFVATIAYAGYETESPATSDASEQFDFTGKRVLVADDYAIGAMATKKMVEAMGFECICVSNGEEAVLWAEGCDVVLMDINMSVCDGLEATRRLRTRGFARPIIAMTASTGAESIEKCLRAGMNEYLAKPFRITQLKEVLGKWLL